MKGKGAPLLPRAKHKLCRPARTERKGGLTKLMVPALRLEKLESMPLPSDRTSLLRTKRIELIPTIEVSTNMERLRNDCFLRSARLGHKNTNQGFKQEVLKQYNRYLRQILTIQRFWRHYRSKRQLKKWLEQRRQAKSQKKKAKQKERLLLSIKQEESQKWKRAAELLGKGSSGSLNMHTVMTQIRKLFNPRALLCNPQDQPSQTDVVSQQKKQECCKHTLQDKSNYTCNYPTHNALQFRLFNSEQPNPQRQPLAPSIASQLQDELIQDFCKELESNRSLFNRIFTRDASIPEEPSKTHCKFTWKHALQCTDLFFSFIRKFCLEQFMDKFSQPFGLTPELSLKSIRGAILQEEMIQHNLREQPLDDQTLLMLSQFIGKRFRKEEFDSAKSSQYCLQLGSISQEQMAMSININCVLTSVIESIGLLKPFGNNGRPPLHFNEHYPYRSFRRLQQEISQHLLSICKMSLIQEPMQFAICIDRAYLEEVEKEWHDQSAHEFEAIYITAMQITEALFWEVSHQLQWCFQRRNAQFQ